MPELPEVEHFRRVAESVLTGPIEAVTVEPDELVFQTAPDEIAAALEGATVVRCERHGKHLALVLEAGGRLHIRFGMTGALHSPDHVPLALEGAKPDLGQWPPKFTKLRIRSGDRELAFTCSRRIARVSLEAADTSFPPHDLGFDALHGDAATELEPALAGKRGSIKVALLDQSVCAGLGNWLVDEVLREARVRPTASVPSLSAPQRERIADAIVEVLRVATAADARSDAFPKRWLFHVRWGRKAAATTLDGTPVEEGRVGGRRTLWVPSELD